ncbi:hypothetical protein E4U19_003593 [Claviceps sp. Clav32 group G5]|nr:hypothetical protein E4U19_003593 [Claviceps sp. Clav32 group G5]
MRLYAPRETIGQQHHQCQKSRVMRLPLLPSPEKSPFVFGFKFPLFSVPQAQAQWDPAGAARPDAEKKPTTGVRWLVQWCSGGQREVTGHMAPRVQDL